jgi:5-methylcytosine-specific restriction endonuclease McrA
MKTIAEYKLDEVLPFIPNGDERVSKRIFIDNNGNEYSIKTQSLRLKTFKRSQTCVCCGLQGTKFLLQRAVEENPHLNLFGEKDGEDILFTMDHFVPQSKGGTNDPSNLQTMCSQCNELKGNSFVSNERLRNLIKEYHENIKSGLTHKQALHILEDAAKYFI